MKTPLLYIATLLSFAAVVPCFAEDPSGPSVSRKTPHIDMYVVAEQVGRSSSGKVGAETQPSACLVFDGGFIEGGDPIGGDAAPAPSAVAAGISAALQSRGYAVNAAVAPAVVLIYHWGVLRPRHWPDISLSHINSNFKARLSLVAPYTTVQTVEQDILANRGSPGSSRFILDQPTYLDARQYARDPRYFVIVTAYDYSALKNRQLTALWRVKTSALETSESMLHAVPALAAGIGPFLGRNLVRPQTERAPLDLAASTSDEHRATSYLLSKETAADLDPSFVATLLKHEHDQFLGEELQDWDEDHWGK